MSHPPEDDPSFSDDLERVADALRDGRPTLDPLALDRVKLRAMSAARTSSSSQQEGFHMKQRFTTLLTVGFLMLGTGGTLALAGGGDGKAGGGSASFHQYKPPCEHGQGRGEDCHKGGGKEGDKGGHGQGGGDKGGQGGGDKGGNGGGDKGGNGGGGGDKGGHGHGSGGKGGHGHH
jgi:hypothetical protein